VQGSLVAVKKVSNHESNLLPEQPYSAGSAAGLVNFLLRCKPSPENPVLITPKSLNSVVRQLTGLPDKSNIPHREPKLLVCQ
jgi:hypothetical protein